MTTDPTPDEIAHALKMADECSLYAEEFGEGDCGTGAIVLAKALRAAQKEKHDLQIAWGMEIEAKKKAEKRAEEAEAMLRLKQDDWIESCKEADSLAEKLRAAELCKDTAIQSGEEFRLLCNRAQDDAFALAGRLEKAEKVVEAARAIREKGFSINVVRLDMALEEYRKP